MRNLLFLIFLAIGINVYSQDYQPVLIKWVDITATDGGWRTYDEMLEWSGAQQDTVTQLGFIVYQDANKLVLTDSYFRNENMIGYCVSIPKSTIVYIKKISIREE